MLARSREALASFLNVPVDEVVLVPNASTAVNVVLRSLRFEKGDVILHFSTVYSAVQKMVEYLRETTEVGSVNVTIEYPISDEVLVSRFRAAIKRVRTEGSKVRIAIFDTISSMPGVSVPWERLVEVCKTEGVLSLVDAAHGAGQIPLHLGKVRPDFLTTTLHK